MSLAWSTWWHLILINSLSSKSADLSSEALDYLKAETSGLVPYTLHLDYDYWTAGKDPVPFSYFYDVVVSWLIGKDEILQVVLPAELREGAPSGFAATGHIGTLSFEQFMSDLIHAFSTR